MKMQKCLLLIGVCVLVVLSIDAQKNQLYRFLQHNRKEYPERHDIRGENRTKRNTDYCQKFRDIWI